MGGTYIKVTDALTGAVTFEEAPQTPTATRWLAARSSETSTQLGAAVVAATAPLLAEQAINAITMGIAGNYIGAITNAIPVLIAIGGAVKAIITPDKKGLTDAQIKTAVTAMSRDELISLLQQSDTGTVQSATSTG